MREDRKQAARECLAWLTFLGFATTFLGFGSVLIFRKLFRFVGFDLHGKLASHWQLLAFLVAIMAIIIALFYLSAICWMFFARLFFTRTEVSRIVFYGPATRFDRWLLEKVFPEDTTSENHV